MKYQIIITRIDTKKTTKRGEYTVIDKVPWTQKELSKASDEIYGTSVNFLNENPLREVRGYAPNYEALESVSTQVLQQEVEDLDLAAVIKAINKL